MGLKAIPMRAETGPIGGDLSHEFLVLAETGESAVFCDRRVLELPVPPEDIDYGGELSPIFAQWSAPYAATSDVHDAARFDSEVSEADRIETRGIEVGQVSYFGTKYSQPMRAFVTGADGAERPVHGGSYGIGISRLVGAIIEASHDESGIIWPEAVAPFRIGLVSLKPGDVATDAACESLYARLRDAGFEVLYDDTQERAGVKFSTMDLIGLPWQVVVGPRGLASGTVELKRRASGERFELTAGDVPAKLVDLAQ
jgi:prolyl-tRNA synthetase